MVTLEDFSSRVMRPSARAAVVLEMNRRGMADAAEEFADFAMQHPVEAAHILYGEWED